MKRLKINHVVLIYALTNLLLNGLVHANGRFDSDTNTISLPCVEILSDGNPTGADGARLFYDLQLSISGDQLPLGAGELTFLSETCTGTFELTTNELTDVLRVGDDLYDLNLTLIDGTYFSVNSFGFLRRGDTTYGGAVLSQLVRQSAWY